MVPEPELGRKALEDQLERLRLELDQVLTTRAEAESSIEETRSKLDRQMARLDGTLELEGRLRGEIEGLQRALESFEPH